jgi:AraC-like DNA-binding protein
VRIHLQREGADRGLLGLLAHRQLGGAVRAMLEEPARNWSLNELAARANASRATFVRMFQRVAQRAPLEFLTELRLELASRKLRNTSLALSDVPPRPATSRKAPSAARSGAASAARRARCAGWLLHLGISAHLLRVELDQRE